MDCSVYNLAAGDLWLSMTGNGGGGGEHDLGMMVAEFVENGSGSLHSHPVITAKDSLFSHLYTNISYHKQAVNQYESDLLSVLNSLMLSINEIDLHFVEVSPCNASCIRYLLVKHLRLSGYDAAVCASKWEGRYKVPRGEYEYIDVIKYNDAQTERLIIDIDFRSHFEIARAINSYNRTLTCLPVVYVGSLSKLNQLLQLMVEAAKISLKQNSMPLPPWRSLAYLQAKWQSPYQRQIGGLSKKLNGTVSSQHKQCGGHLKSMQSLIRSEMEVEGLLKPMSKPKDSDKIGK